MSRRIRRAAVIVLELILIAGSMVATGYLAQRAIEHGLTKPGAPAITTSPPSGAATP